MKGPSKNSNLNRLWNLRWKARTDLLWLCHNVLDYTLINPKIHGPMIAHLQQFKIPTLPGSSRPSMDLAAERDKILDSGKFEYTPGDPYTELEGSRRRVLLFSRGYYKTTSNTIAHTIQWLLNYPQIGMALLFSTDDKAQKVLQPIRTAFQYNAKLRELFPEYCPRIRVDQWGNNQNFILENREDILHRLKLPPRVEPSVMSQSLEKSKAGFHFDIMKCSDVVDEENVRTDAQRYSTKERFGLLKNLLVKRFDGQDGWIDVEGTFYHVNDLHVDLCEQWLERYEKGKGQMWDIFVRGCFERDTGELAPRFNPWELFKCPFKVDASGRRIPVWPETDPIEKLEEEEKDPIFGGRVFFYQRVLDVKADTSTERPFGRPITWVKREDFVHVPIAYHVMSIDLANTVKKKSNYSVIVTAAYDREGRCYVHNVQRGKWTQDEQIKRIFDTYKKFRPIKVIIEETGYVQGAKSSFEREQSRRGLYLPWHFSPALRNQSKVERIINSLQGPMYTPFNKPDLQFVTPLDLADEVHSTEIEKILEREFSDCTVFDTGSSDDIIDAIAYQYLCREYFGPEGIRGGAHLQELEAIARLQKEQYEEAYKNMVFGGSPEPIIYGPWD